MKLKAVSGQHLQADSNVGLSDGLKKQKVLMEAIIHISLYGLKPRMF